MRATLGIPQYILLEATLSFIGIGAPPMPSWGAMINEGFNVIFSYPHMVVLPEIAIALMMLSFAFLGDCLRDALGPYMRTLTSLSSPAPPAHLQRGQLLDLLFVQPQVHGSFGDASNLYD